MKAYLRGESGATAIEYGMIVALMSIVIITGISAFGTSTKDLYNYISSVITGVAS